MASNKLNKTNEFFPITKSPDNHNARTHTHIHAHTLTHTDARNHTRAQARVQLMYHFFGYAHYFEKSVINRVP